MEELNLQIAGGVIITDNAGSTELTVADGQVTIAGNLTVSGTTTIVDSTTVEVGDSMLKLAKDNNDSSDAADFGIYGLYTDGSSNMLVFTEMQLIKYLNCLKI